MLALSGNGHDIAGHFGRIIFYTIRPLCCCALHANYAPEAKLLMNFQHTNQFNHLYSLNKFSLFYPPSKDN